MAQQMEDYARIRIAWLLAARQSDELQATQAATAAAQTRIWGHAMAIARARPDPLAVSLLTALNETFDLATSQRFIFLGQIPEELPWMLLALSLLGVSAIDYQSGRRGSMHVFVTTSLLVAWSACIVLIADLTGPRFSWSKVDPAPYLWTLRGFAGGAFPAPPR